MSFLRKTYREMRRLDAYLIEGQSEMNFAQGLWETNVRELKGEPEECKEEKQPQRNFSR